MTWPGAPGTPCAEGVRCSSISSIRPLRVVLIQRDELNDSAIRRNGWIVTRLGSSTPRCILYIQIVKLSTASAATMLLRTAYEGSSEVALAYLSLAAGNSSVAPTGRATDHILAIVSPKSRILSSGATIFPKRMATDT
jgi:hypothetical protein